MLPCTPQSHQTDKHVAHLHPSTRPLQELASRNSGKKWTALPHLLGTASPAAAPAPPFLSVAAPGVNIASMCPLSFDASQDEMTNTHQF